MKIDLYTDLVLEDKALNNVISDEDLFKSMAILMNCIVSENDVYLFETDEAQTLPLMDLKNINIVKELKNSQIKFHFKTSGTTGKPKLVIQPIQNLLKGVKYNDELHSAVWGYCYSTRHISGILMMLQALSTDRPLVDLRNKSISDVTALINKEGITHISAPATFYRLSFPLAKECPSVIKVTNGGEPLDELLIKKIIISLPNAEIRNIYASTEFGSLLVSKSEKFYIPNRLKEVVKIANNTIFVNEDIVSDSAETKNGWYDTKDIVEWEDDIQFCIKGESRKILKVLGHLVSLRKVEQKIYQIEGIRHVSILSKEHQVFGNLLTAHIVMDEGVTFDKKHIKSRMKELLRDYEIPTKIKQAESLKLTDSGKLSRV